MIVDRFEGDFAIVEIELGKYVNIERNKLPQNTKEQDCIFLMDGVYVLDEAETKRVRENNLKLQNSLWKEI